MILNPAMKKLLCEYDVGEIENIPCNDAWPVWRKEDTVGRPYWGTGSFCGMDRIPICADRNLSWLEWDGNEVHLGGYMPEEITGVLRQALGILGYWRKELRIKYPDVSFYLFASFDDGRELDVEEGELPAQAVTLRFWADRGDADVLNLHTFHEWDQPAMVMHTSKTEEALYADGTIRPMEDCGRY